MRRQARLPPSRWSSHIPGQLKTRRIRPIVAASKTSDAPAGPLQGEDGRRADCAVSSAKSDPNARDIKARPRRRGATDKGNNGRGRYKLHSGYLRAGVHNEHLCRDQAYPQPEQQHLEMAADRSQPPPSKILGPHRSSRRNRGPSDTGGGCDATSIPRRSWSDKESAH